MSAEVVAASKSTFIGAHSYMNGLGYVRSNVFIGRYCSIGRRVTLGAFGHAMTGLSTCPALSGGDAQSNYTREEMEFLTLPDAPLRSRYTVIQSDVWIGDGAIILPGVTVGVGAVIGANSVVLRDVAPYEIVGGIPAKPIRKRFPAEVCDRLLQSEWWELPLETLQSLDTGNVLRFLDAFEAQKPFNPAPYATYSFEI